MIKIGKLTLQDHMPDTQKLQYLNEKIDIIKGIMESNGDEICSIQTIRLTNAKKTYGSCVHKGKGKVILQFSRLNFVAGNDDSLNNTIAHELIHAMVDMSCGHGKKWQDRAREYSKLLQTPIKTTNPISDARMEGDISGAWAVGKAPVTPRYRISCPCGKVKILKYRACRMTSHPARYKCKHCKEGIIVEKLR